jgi:hypothetical protein
MFSMTQLLLNIDLHHLKGCWEQTLVHIIVAVHMSLNSIASCITGSSERERKSEYGTEEGEWNAEFNKITMWNSEKKLEIEVSEKKDFVL